MSNQNILTIVSVGEEKQSKDERNYRTVGFLPHIEGGLLSNQKIRRRNIWEEGPAGSPGDTIYPHLKKGAKVIGKIETVAVKPYFIPNEFGKDTDGNGNPANKVSQYTDVVFESETIESLARRNGHTPLSDVNTLEETDSTDDVQEMVNDTADMGESITQ